MARFTITITERVENKKRHTLQGLLKQMPPVSFKDRLELETDTDLVAEIAKLVSQSEANNDTE